MLLTVGKGIEKNIEKLEAIQKLSNNKRVIAKAEVKINFLSMLEWNEELCDMIIDYQDYWNMGEFIEVLVKLLFDNKAEVSKSNSVDLKTNRFAYEIKFQPKGGDLASKVDLDKIAKDVIGIIFIKSDEVLFLHRSKFAEAKKYQTKQGKFNHSFLENNSLLTKTMITEKIANWLTIR